MNWTIIDANTKATEIPGAGCFVMFFNSNICFAPGVCIKSVLTKSKLETFVLAASPVCGTHISFMTDGSTSTLGWAGDAGDKLDAKLAELEQRGPAKVDMKKFKKMPLGKKTKKKTWHD